MRDWEVVLGVFARGFDDDIADDDMMWRDARFLCVIPFCTTSTRIPGWVLLDVHCSYPFFSSAILPFHYSQGEEQCI